MEICDRTLSDEIKAALRLPAFDSYEWEDEDVLYLMQTMFIDTGLVDKFNIPLPTLREWLYEVYKHYNAVPFHNFRHCFCVAQMVSSVQCEFPNQLNSLNCFLIVDFRRAFSMSITAILFFVNSPIDYYYFIFLFFPFFSFIHHLFYPRPGCHHSNRNGWIYIYKDVCNCLQNKSISENW